MTDNEIIKALECCRDNDNNLNMEKCFEVCPYDGECAGEFMQDVLSLINRQKEEIKRLKNRDMQVEVSDRLEREIKAEAVEEFAEKVKDTDCEEFMESYYENAELCYEFRQDQFRKHISNLIKEMVGENKCLNT